MSFGFNAGNLTIAGSASASNIIDGGGCTLVGWDFTTTVSSTGFYIKEGPSASDLKKVYDSAGSQITLTLPAAAASSAVNVKLPPEKHYNVRFFQICASSAQSSAVVVRPVWARPLDG
jgi:hypothetical protein